MKGKSYLWSKELENKVLFLSASFPQPERDLKYFKTANPLEITDAVIAVARAVFSRKGKLVFGGHPTISPLILSVGEEFLPILEEEGNLPIVYIYQSEYYKKDISKYTLKLVEKKIGEIIWTPCMFNDREKCLYKMRYKMLSDTEPIAAIFIGGMEGIEEEFNLFIKKHSKTPVYPIGSTGGASKILLEKKIMRAIEMKKWGFEWKYGSNEILNELDRFRIYPSLINRILCDLRRNSKNKNLWR
ncbi:hypothetical protein LR013_02005 [candidate division NPL-UPA2 bacterium]|nr:hypothetical protein [candidate division NPL-UPA2 bacterium]